DQEVERTAHGVSGALQPLTTCAVVRGIANAYTKPRLDISLPAVDSRFPLGPGMWRRPFGFSSPSRSSFSAGASGPRPGFGGNVFGRSSRCRWRLALRHLRRLQGWTVADAPGAGDAARVTRDRKV